MKPVLLTLAGLLASSMALSAEISVPIRAAEKQGDGAALGSVRIVETPYGLAFHPDLKGLTPGLHGFHVHEKPSCAPGESNGASVPALGAGGHLDPQGSKKHGEPWGDGHLGDLPPLVVADNGGASTAVTAPRLTKLSEVKGKALMIHAGGDNYADQPKPLGGGGDRIACGVIQ